MSKLSNELLMIQYLKNGRKYSTKELSEKLEVSPRMIKVYKEDLEKAGIYLESVKGPYGGYILRNKTFLPPLLFTSADYEELKKINTSKEVQNIIQKMKYAVLTEEENLFYKSDIYRKIAKSIKEKRKVKILYKTKEKITERIIYPYHILYFGENLGCAAYCETKKDLRHFSFHRIQNIEVLDTFYKET